MKKIGILTFHRSINYGAFMQSYSLAQQLIKRYGSIVEVIDFEKASKHSLYHTKHGFFHALVFGQSREIMRSRFHDDLNLLPLSSQSLITDNYDEVFRFLNGRYDILIVGSDAVWAYNKGLGLNNPYWLFGDSLQCEKLSYAASAYSLDHSAMSDEDKLFIRSCLKSFSYIGVRDQETENLVKMCLPEATVYRNCDPTVLLDKPNQEITQKIRDGFKLNTRKKLITIMMGRYESIVYDVIHKLGRKDYEYVFLYSRMKARERFFPWSPRFLYNLSPFEWYHVFGAAYMNLTTYFHGTLLAYKSNVPTITFDTTELGGDYKSKIQQVTDDFGMSRFYNSYNKGLTEDIILKEVEYIVNNHDEISSQIEMNMSREAKKSLSFFEHLDKSIQ